jgi:hypothetical protein
LEEALIYLLIDGHPIREVMFHDEFRIWYVVGHVVRLVNLASFSSTVMKKIFLRLRTKVKGSDFNIQIHGLTITIYNVE